MSFDAEVERLVEQTFITPEEAQAIGERFLYSDEPRPRNRGPSGDRCPHGDEACPCQDYGDPCHYEGTDPFECANPEQVDGHEPHCHVEGCEWNWLTPSRRCGLDRLELERVWPGDRGLDALRGTPWWACGLLRMAASR